MSDARESIKEQITGATKERLELQMLLWCAERRSKQGFSLFSFIYPM